MPQPLPAAGASRLPLLDSRDLAAVAAAFRTFLPTGPQVEENLRGVLDDTLNRPGSLFRAQLIYAGARRRGISPAGAREMAVAIEYFHTASLLFDDLPAMDDAHERRGFPCAHLRHGEAAAMLGALALVNQGHHLLWRSLARLPPRRAARAARLANACLGLRGILDGQSRDLHFQSSARGEAEVAAVAAGKTVTLIRLTLVLPALAGGAGRSELAALERLSRAWGHAYQIADDFKDLLMEAAETGKSARRDDSLGRPNLPAAIGLAAAYHRLEQRLAEGRALLAELPAHPELRRLHQILEEETAAIAGRLPAADLAADLLPAPAFDPAARPAAEAACA